MLVSCLMLAACGRIGFGLTETGATDPDGGSNGDGTTGDGPDTTGLPLASCEGLAASCGPTGTESCCQSPLVPGGTFARGYDAASDGMYPNQSFPATVSQFRLDRYEVTVGRFRKFLDAGQGTQTQPPATGSGARTLAGMADQGGWEAAWNTALAADRGTLSTLLVCDVGWPTWTDNPGPNESLPINCVSWYEAFAFCAWDGGFLPTEAEWNFAASGGDEARAYPWSNPPGDTTADCSHATFFDGAYCAGAPEGSVSVVGNEAPEGDGRWGQSDLAGNVAEWVLDWYESTFSLPCDDCAVVQSSSSERVTRGGAFASAASNLRTARRSLGPPDTRSVIVGFRCARAP